MSSNKMKRLVIVLAVFLLLAIGGYLIADHIIGQKEQKAADEKASLNLFSFDPNSIDKVTLDTVEGNFKMEVVDSVWTITETDYPHEFILNNAYVTTVCSYMSGLVADTKFDIGDADLANYGLADPVVLTCSAGNTDYTLYVGNATPTQEYFYAMLPNNDTVFGIPYDYGVLFYGDTSFMKTPYMIPYTEVEIEEIALERSGKTVFDLVQADRIWTAGKEMPEVKINSAKVNSMLTSMTRVQVENFIGLAAEGTDPAAYELDKPYATLTYRTTDGNTHIIDFAPHDVNDGIVHVYFRNEGEVVTMTQGNIAFLNTELYELMNQQILPININETASLDVTVDDISFRMEMDAANGSYIFDGTDVGQLTSNTLSTFMSLFDTVSLMSFDTVDLEAEVDVTAEPDAVFHYTLLDGTETELSLIAIDDTSYWALVDGEYTGMTVRRRALSSATGVLTFHERMVDAITEAESSAS